MSFWKRQKTKRSKPQQGHGRRVKPHKKPNPSGWAEHDRLQIITFWNNPTGLR